jgi:hypothetical protein
MHSFKYRRLIGLIIFIMIVVTTANLSMAANPNGDLSINIITAYNFVVDSNVETPATYAPEAATVGAQICNTGSNDMTDVQIYIGDYSTQTYGTYPTRDSSTGAFIAEHPHLADTGTYSFTHEGGSAGTDDAYRYIPTLDAGECTTQYWVISYPRRANPDNSGTTVTGNIKPEDDLYLFYDIWATAIDGGTSITADQRRRATMRNEISAAANKIWPNGDNKVPEEYRDAIVDAFGWDTITPSGTSSAFPGEEVTTQGIWYDFGNINHGFDNDGDYVPDQNAWVQPVGNPGVYDPGCFRLVGTYGLVVVKLVDSDDPTVESTESGEYLIPFENQMYFDYIPENSGVVGLVYYVYEALDGACTASLTPYQEVASGYDNEKFSGDYGTGIPPLQSVEPAITFDKQVLDGATWVDPSLAPPGSVLTYRMQFVNNSYDETLGLGVTVGSPDTGNALVIEDQIPAGTEYVAGSAFDTIDAPNTPSDGYRIMFSTDNGLTWIPAPTVGEEPTAASVTNIQWWRTESVDYLGTGEVQFQITVPGIYSEDIVLNESGIQLGNNPPMIEDDATTIITGINSISGTIFADNGSGAQYANAVLDASETDRFDDVTVTLFIEQNGEYVEMGSTDSYVDGSDPQIPVSFTATTGEFIFSDLPDGNYRVVVTSDDSDISTGYALTNSSDTIDVDLDSAKVIGTAVASTDNDFGFAPALVLTKNLTTATPSPENSLVTYDINIENKIPGDGTATGTCQYTMWNADSTSSDYTSPDNAEGAPDFTYASVLLPGAAQSIAFTNFDSTAMQGSLVSAQLVIDIFTDLDPDTSQFILAVGATNLENITNDASAFDALGIEGLSQPTRLTYNVTGLTLASFTTTTPSVSLTMKKGTAPDDETVYIDAVGFIITTDEVCSDPSKALNPVPLTDTYPSDLLEFVSSDPDITSSSISGTTGTLTWNNVGPIYAGGTQTVSVTYRVKDGVGTDSGTNAATATGATFTDGTPANDDNDTAPVNTIRDGSIAGTIFSDTNTSGWDYESGTDLPIEGVTVTLYRCSGTNNANECNDKGTIPVAIATTASDGAYSFIGLNPDSYFVQVDTTTIPGTVTQTGDPDDNEGAGGDGDGDDNASDALCGTEGGGQGADDVCDNEWGGDTEVFTMGTDTWNGDTYDYTEVDFGYTTTASISGIVWNNYNGDTASPTSPDTGYDITKSDDEPVISGVEVILYDSGDNEVDTTTTDANGEYEFLNVVSGTGYYVRVSGTYAGSGWTHTGEERDDGTPVSASDVDDNTIYDIDVVAGEIKRSYDFGYTETGTFDIGDTLYYDFNGNGSQQTSGTPTEEGIANVTVNLYRDIDDDGLYDPDVDIFVATTVTDADGNYLFENKPISGHGSKPQKVRVTLSVPILTG